MGAVTIIRSRDEVRICRAMHIHTSNRIIVCRRARSGQDDIESVARIFASDKAASPVDPRRSAVLCIGWAVQGRGNSIIRCP